MLNKLDATLQGVCPTVMVPRHEALMPLAESGHRFLAARDGLYAEVKRPWLRSTFRVAESAVPLPYGEVIPATHFSIDRRQLAESLDRFIEEARQAFPKEHAAWLSFMDGEGLRYEPVRVESSGGGHIRYRRPTVAGGRVLAIDIHSHGRHDAFWSVTDDRDDKDDAKLAIVFGNLDAPQPSVKARLLALGAAMDFSELVDSIWNTQTT
jgi:PRTRC genetic system protein A